MNSTWHQLVTTMLSGHFSTLWPIAVVPLFVAGLLRPALALIEGMPAGARAQRQLAFLASVLPGVVFWCALLSGTHVMPTVALHSFACAVHCAILTLVGAIVPLRACIPFIGQRAQFAQLFEFCRPLSVKLKRAASELGIPVCEIATVEPLCCIAGIINPRLLVSTGAVQMLSDQELRAALLHESAHLRRHETLWVSLATLLNRSSLLTVPRALKVFRDAGEYAADREAARDSNPLDLASALLRLGRSGFLADSLAINFVSGETVLARARQLLYDEPATKAGSRVFLSSIVLLTTAALSLLPWAVRLVGYWWCR